MLVARVCQLYPNAAAGVIVSKFFNIMHQWNRPQPVMLKTISDGPLQVRVWNPKLYPADKLHRMPIITPAYPSMCSTHNVTQSTEKIIIEEFKRGAEITDHIIVGKASWNELFEKHTFFYKYKYYIQVIASSDSEDNILKWGGLIESKLRQLILKLELTENLQFAHPFIKGFANKIDCFTEQEAIDAAHGILKKSIETPDKEILKTVHTITFFVGLSISPKTGNVNRKLDISWPTSEFLKLVKSWEKYENATMGIVIQCIKSQNLPDEVFEDGEKPRQSKKRSKKSTDPSNTVNKRPKPATHSTDEIKSNTPVVHSQSVPVINSKPAIKLTLAQSE
jgi:poly(A) polymerase